MDLTEGGIRVPWIAHWPAGIRPGRISAEHCMTMDWSATMLDLAGITPDPGYPLDGVSLARVLREPDHGLHRPMHWRMKHRGQRALRDGDWKYLRVDDNDYLFNIPGDARERANKARQEPQRLDAMREAWEARNAGDPGRSRGACGPLGQGHAAALTTRTPHTPSGPRAAAGQWP